jgi:hypothetical protein
VIVPKVRGGLTRGPRPRGVATGHVHPPTACFWSAFSSPATASRARKGVGLLRRRQGVALRHAADDRLHGHPRPGQGRKPRPLLGGARRPALAGPRLILGRPSGFGAFGRCAGRSVRPLRWVSDIAPPSWRRLPGAMADAQPTSTRLWCLGHVSNDSVARARGPRGAAAARAGRGHPRSLRGRRRAGAHRLPAATRGDVKARQRLRG